MSSNNFLNRKKLDLNLMNRGSYKRSDVRKSVTHPFMKSAVSHVPSDFPYNPSQLGLYLPYLHTNNVPYQFHEHQVVIDSFDRDFTVYPNPYKFSVKFGVSSPSPTIPYSNVNNVKYISIDNVILPYKYELLREDISNNTTLINAIDVSKNVLSINTSVTIASKNIQICNLVVNGAEWEINYTENNNTDTVYHIIKKTTSTSYRYTIGSNKVLPKLISIKIDNMASYILSTNNKSPPIIQLYPKKIIADSLWFNIKKNLIVFKNSETSTVKKLDIGFIDNDFNDLNMAHLDTTIKTDKYTDASYYSSPAYYIRHPCHTKWQTHLTLKLGTIEPYIKTSL